MRNTNEVVKTAVPFFKKGSNGRAVLIIHGFTGYPGPYYEMAELIHAEGYTVSLPRLPGHGTCRADFRKSDWRDWLNHTRNAYMDLAASHEAVSIVGLSMGGVMTLILASRFSAAKICLLAPAMAVTNPLFYLTPLLRFFMPVLPSDWEPGEDDDEDKLFLGKEYWTKRISKQYAGLYRLIRMARRRLGSISSPALLVLSEADTTVPMRAGDIIQDGLKNCELKKVILKESPHVLIEGPEKGEVYKNVIDWLNTPT